MSEIRAAVEQAAIDRYYSIRDDVQFPDTDDSVSRGEQGYWIMAYLFVPEDEVQEYLDLEDPECP